MDLRSLFTRKSAADSPAPEQTPLSVEASPEQPHFIVGDLHGRSDLLERILEKIDAVIGAEALSSPVLCFVGNIVGHGPDTRGSLIRMKELTDEFPDNVICLMGNHEQMLLDFLQAPAARQARWLRDGGAAICASYGIDLTDPDAQNPETLSALLQNMIGPDLLAWLAARPVRRRSGNMTIVHAAVDPARGMDDQTDRVMIWGHPEFMTRPRTDNHWIAHGHYPVDQAGVSDGRIAVNTDVTRTGVLSCAFVPMQGEVRVLEAKA